MKHRFIVFFLLLLVFGVPIVAGSMDVSMQEAVESLQHDIARDTDALIALRATIAEKRALLADEVAERQQQAAHLRAEVERLSRLRQQGEQDQARLRESAASARESLDYAETLLTEYARSLETRLTAVEAAGLSPDLIRLREQLPEADAAGLGQLASALLDIAKDWQQLRAGGHRMAGIALDADGVAQPGQFAVFGPLVFFAAAETATAGIAIPRLGRMEPGLHTLPYEGQSAIRALLDGTPSRIATDVTGGDAIRLEESRMHYLARLRQGGFVMIPLLMTGALALLLAVWKLIALWQLHRAVQGDVQKLAEHLHQGNLEQARVCAAAYRAPLSDLALEAIMHRNVPRAHLEELLHEHVVNVLPQAERHLGMLGVLGGVAPLLGLLGTVTGMIHTFRLVTLFGSGDARMLSGGISEALVTTETGLIIAVPVLLVQAGLARWARSVVSALERQAIAIVNHLHIREDPT